MNAPKPAEVIIGKRVGTSDLPEDACGFAATPGSPPCGYPAIARGLMLGTWEGESTVAACLAHYPALKELADESWLIDEGAP